MTFISRRRYHIVFVVLVILALLLFSLSLRDDSLIGPENVDRLTIALALPSGTEGGAGATAVTEDWLAVTNWREASAWHLQTGAYHIIDFLPSGGFTPGIMIDGEGRPLALHQGDRQGITIVGLTDGGRLAFDVPRSDYAHAWSLSPDGSRLVTPLDMESVGVFDARSGALLITIPLPAGYRLHWITPTYSPDGQMLALVFTEDNEAMLHDIFLYDAQSGDLLRTLHGDTAQRLIYDLAFSPDGALLMAVGNSPYSDELRFGAGIGVWEVETGRRVMVWREGELGAHEVKFTADGRHAAAYGPRNLWLWDTQAPMGAGRAVIFESRTHEELSFEAMDFSPDGRLLAVSVSLRPVGGLVWFYDVATGQHVATRKFNDGHIREVRFSPDGRQLITAGSGDRVRIWTIDGANPYPAIGSAESISHPAPLMTPTVPGV